jgi:hypothetical protein
VTWQVGASAWIEMKKIERVWVPDDLQVPSQSWTLFWIYFINFINSHLRGKYSYIMLKLVFCCFSYVMLNFILTDIPSSYAHFKSQLEGKLFSELEQIVT